MSSALHCTKLHHCTTVSTGFYHFNILLVGGFNPFEKYLSKWESSPNRGEQKMQPPPSLYLYDSLLLKLPVLSAGKAAYPFGARRDMPIKKSSCAKELNMPNRIICPNKPQARYWIFSNSKDKRGYKTLVFVSCCTQTCHIIAHLLCQEECTAKPGNKKCKGPLMPLNVCQLV